MTDPLLERACEQRMIPVVVVDDIATAAPLGRALASAGARAVEVTLRTPASERSLAVLAERGDLLVGAGTVVRPGQVDAAMRAGGRSSSSRPVSMRGSSSAAATSESRSCPASRPPAR